MNLFDELAQYNPPQELLARVMALLSKHSENQTEQINQQLENQAEQLKLAEQKIQALTHELAYYKRLRFGVKSETLSAGQLNLFEENCDIDQIAIHTEIENSQKDKKREPRKVQPLPPDLPRVEILHDLQSCQCEECGGALHKIRDEVREKLDYIPGRFQVERHIYPQYACRQCSLITAQLSVPSIIEGGYATGNLLAWVAVQKFLDHLPLYRIEEICTREGVPIARSTLAEWIAKIGGALEPLYSRLIEKLHERTTLHADETPIRQLEPGSGKTHRSYLWAYRSNELEDGAPIIVFDYQTSRSGSHAQQFLKNWRGHLMVDDFAGYKSLFGAGITELACLAHMRRKFFDLHVANQSLESGYALNEIGKLYDIERQCKELDAQSRYRIRQEQAKPIANNLHQWLLQTKERAAQGGALIKAIDYSLRRWQEFIRYLENGMLPIDNNPVENSIRPIAIGKKNWLFAGSERAGKRAAVIQSLLGTAKLNGLEPQRWLADTLNALPTCLQRDLDRLLPLRKT